MPPLPGTSDTRCDQLTRVKQNVQLLHLDVVLLPVAPENSLGVFQLCHTSGFSTQELSDSREPHLYRLEEEELAYGT